MDAGQAWDDYASFQQAFAIGTKEAQATWNLLSSIHPSVTDALTLLVQLLGLNYCFHCFFEFLNDVDTAG